MGSVIRAVATYFPEETVLTNKDLERILAFSRQETSDEWILQRTGISKRRIASKDETVGVLAYKAACNALDSLTEDIPPIEHIVFATNTAELPFPNSASETHALLRESHKDRVLPNAGFSDTGSGCGGINLALKYGDALVRSGMHQTVLVVGADKLSAVTNYADRQTCILFEDGASADILSGVSNNAGFRGHCDYGDGSARNLITCTMGEKVDIIEALRLLREGGEPVKSHGRILGMQGQAVFKYVSRIWDEVLGGLTENKSLNPDKISYEDINWISAHLANFRCLTLKEEKYPGFLKKCGLDGSLEHFCNSSTASQGKRRKQFVENALPGEHHLGVGYGAGTYAGANLYRKP